MPHRSQEVSFFRVPETSGSTKTVDALYLQLSLVKNNLVFQTPWISKGGPQRPWTPLTTARVSVILWGPWDKGSQKDRGRFIFTIVFGEKKNFLKHHIHFVFWSPWIAKGGSKTPLREATKSSFLVL